ncbi:MAG: ATP-binding protein [Calditrichaeota bacterium]|nr:ATP-binding protein [Calditrichota bacterium]
MLIERIIQLPDMSFFLFGARQTGKTTLIQSRFKESIWTVNLLLSETFYRYQQQPQLFLREAEYQIQREKIRYIFVDEIQRLPTLLNDIHYLMEKYPQVQFILTGSSARKLRRGGYNLLAGRAIQRYLFPFVFQEIREWYTLDEILRFGTLPPLLYRHNNERVEILRAYVDTYLKEEIIAEAFARNVGGFYRFLELAAGQFTEIINYNAIARDAGVSVKTVQSYYSILEDTLIGFYLWPWRKSVRKRLRLHPKFYFFDNGVTNAANRMLGVELPPIWKGKLFEQFIIQELFRYKHYLNSESQLFFWRTAHGAEVDVLIVKGEKIHHAIEIKYSSRIENVHLRGLVAFREEHPEVPCTVVATVSEPFVLKGITVLPYERFLTSIADYL